MEQLKKIADYNNLFDFYQALLTEKQKNYFIMYFQKDYTLKEIADYYQISRNAVHDLIQVTLKKLEEYESILNLSKNKQTRKQYLNNYFQSKDEEWLNKILEMEDQ